MAHGQTAGDVGAECAPAVNDAVVHGFEGGVTVTDLGHMGPRVGAEVIDADDIDNGRLSCLIGLAPVKPAEFVILRFRQRTSEAQS